MPSVLVTDYTFDSLDIETAALEPLGLTVQGTQCRTQSELIEHVSDADYLMVQFAPVDASVIHAMKAARVIVRYGIGYDNVDIQAAKERGIPVCNVPDYCIDEVADHALAFMLTATRQIVPNARHVATGQWGRVTPLNRMKALKDLAVGLVGFGRIGRAVASRLRAFKCTLLVHDPVVPPEEIHAAGAQPVDLDTLLRQSDLVSLHCPALPDTHHLIRHDTIQQMKDGAVLINVARGALVHTADLTEALRNGKLSYAALDVLEQEPPEQEEPLRSLDNVILHSHIASSSPAAAIKLRRTAASIIAAAAEGRPLPNIVNP